MNILALGNKESAFYKSIASILDRIGHIIFKSEHDFEKVNSLIDYVRDNSIDKVLMPNPYGNNKRIACYKKLKEKNIEIICSDRGALPDSWFFDKGFNYDSPSYSENQWNKPLSISDEKNIDEYINKIKITDKALEKQGKRIGGENLKNKLGLQGKKILFVPLQRPNDSVIKNFSGHVSSVHNFIEKVSEISSIISKHNWIVVIKKHPLESEYIIPKSHNVKYVYDSAHAYDLIEMSDSVLLINSGIGVLAMAWKKPVFHFGEAFYSINGVNKKVESSCDAAKSITNGLNVDPYKVKQFFFHLINNIYSFGSFNTEEIKEKDGSSRTITRHIEFKSLRINGKKIRLDSKKILIITSVVPIPIYRGSQARIDSVIKSLISSEFQVGIVIMNSSFKGKKSKDIKKQIIESYPGINYVKVIASPKFSSNKIEILRNYFTEKIDSILNKNRVYKWSDTPPKFKRAANEAVTNFDPDSILINYAKLTRILPKNFNGEKIVDTHDYQTALLEENLRQNGNIEKVKLERHRESEKQELIKYDKIIAINANEKKQFEALLKKPVYCTPAFYQKNIDKNKLFIGYEFDAIFVGSISTFNIDGLKWFIDYVLPIIKQKHPDFRLAIVGDICKAKSLEFKKFSGIERLGRVKDLKYCYQLSKIAIAPILAGAGMKIKVIEAMSYGKVSVGTSKAFDGINISHNKSGLIANEPKHFAEYIINVTTDDSLRIELEKEVINLYEKEHSLTAVKKSLEHIFST